MNPIFFLPLLVLALWAIDRRLMQAKLAERDAMLDRAHKLRSSPNALQNLALLDEYESNESSYAEFKDFCIGDLA